MRLIFYIGMCWDEDNVVSRCRSCQAEFTASLRKHHCRNCGGIFCDVCAPRINLSTSDSSSSPKNKSSEWYPGKYLGRKKDHDEDKLHNEPQEIIDKISSKEVYPGVTNVKTREENVEISDAGKGDEESKKGWYPGKFLGLKKKHSGDTTVRVSDVGEYTRSCIGCRLGETPGEKTRSRLMELYIAECDRHPDAPPLPPASYVNLTRGSLYGEGDKLLKRDDGDIAHGSGYFELINKSDFVCGIKVFYSGSEVYRECCRYPYIAGRLSIKSIYGFSYES